MSLIVDMRKDAAVTVTRWITDAHGDDVASLWVWECTPMPCGLPSDEQLQEGLSLALGEVTIGALLAKSYHEMNEELALCNARQAAQSESDERP